MSSPTALLVIDVQNSFTQRPYWDKAELPNYLDAQNRLIQGFITANQPIIRIYHVEPEGPFSHTSGFVQPLTGLAVFRPARTLEKSRHSAFAGTDLAAWLIENNLRDLVISGIRTEQCCETTTRHGSDLGFRITYVPEATLTFAMTHANGRTYTANEIRERTELVLAGRFATIASVNQVLATIPSP
jgi:nicotinamidase-related amidase